MCGGVVVVSGGNGVSGSVCGGWLCVHSSGLNIGMVGVWRGEWSCEGGERKGEWTLV